MITQEVGPIYRKFRGESEYQIMVDIINGSKDTDGLEQTALLEDTANQYKHLKNCNPYTDMVFAEVGGQTVGYGRCWWEEQIDGPLVYSLLAHLLPAYRNNGIRRDILHRMESRLQQIGAKHQAKHQKVLQAEVNETESHWAQLLESEGYKIVRYGLKMVRPNWDNIPDCPLPEGIVIRSGGKVEEYRQIWDAACEAFRDNWGESECTEVEYAEWRGEPTFQPPLWRVAWADNEVAGGVLNFILKNENEEYGRKRGYTETIFVRRPWRGRGLAKALISRSFLAHQKAGMTEAALGLDADNLSGALHLYHHMGFAETKRSMIYRKPLIING